MKAFLWTIAIILLVIAILVVCSVLIIYVGVPLLLMDLFNS